MKITLLNVLSKNNRYHVNKDVMGSFGLVTRIGNSFLAKVIEGMKKKGVNLPIFSLAYLAAILYKNGHKVEFKTNTMPEDSNLVIIPSSIVEFKAELKMARLIKEKTKAKVGFIGAFASVKPELYLKYADFVIKGEPEDVISKIKDSIPKGFIKSKLMNLDELPFPKWDIFPVEEYSYYPVIKGKPFLPVLSSRGCALNCNYCPYKLHYGNWRRRSPENIINEIRYLVDKFNIKGLLFRDPLFTLDKKRVREIAKRLIDFNLEWACETHFDYLDKDLIDLMYESGLRSINVGIESSDENILANATRKSSRKRYVEMIIRYCQKKGIKITSFYILGFPDDTEDSINRTIRYAKKLNTHVAQFFIMTPFPGTKFYDSIKDDIFEKDFEKFDSFTPVFKHKNLSSEDLLRLKEKAFVSYYFRLRYMLSYIKRLFL